jgi:hypothetical protein
MNQIDIETRWCTASPLVGSGFDSRSSDNGLLSIMYGSVERASHFGWLNAGRTLVDKTYIHLLLQAKQLPSFGVTHHDIAPQLELFVRANLQPIWADIEKMSVTKKQELAIRLVNLAAGTLFGSSHQAQSASWLLFYLCPQLPIFPITDYLDDALMQHNLVSPSDKPYQGIDCYQGYQGSAQALYKKLQPLMQCMQPTANYGNEKDQVMVNSILVNSDWWKRHYFLHFLQVLEAEDHI